MTCVPYQVYGGESTEHCQLDMINNLVLVSADKAQTSQWRDTLAILSQKKSIAHIVFNEAHIPLFVKVYHHTLANIYQVRSIPVQLVLLSATLPPSMITEVKYSYQLTDNVIIIRQSTNQLELKYFLEKLSSESLIDRTQAILKDEMESWDSDERALIFVSSLATGEKLVNIEGCILYTRDKDKITDEEWHYAYWLWRTGVQKVMVATTAFTTGNDYPHVHLVIHIGNPFKMLKFIQAQGRAGRDGQLAKCYTLVTKNGWPPKIDEPGVKKNNKIAMHEHLYVYGLKCCLRYGVTLFKDGFGISCQSIPGNELCCVCETMLPMIPAPFRSPPCPNPK